MHIISTIYEVYRHTGNDALPCETLTASNPDIFKMEAVLYPPVILGAVLKSALSASARHLVQPYRVITFSELCHYKSYSTVVTKTLAYHRCIHVIPAVVTYRTPYAIMEHFHATLVVTFAIDESDRSCQINGKSIIYECSLIARFMGSTWGPSGADMTQVGPMLAPWTLLSGLWYSETCME